MTKMTKWIAERNRVLRELDVESASLLLGQSFSERAALIGLHKCRYECADIEDELRHESRAWLESRGYDRFAGLPWPDDGELPK